MFVRKKKNRSGTVSVQVISKDNKKYKVIKSFGASFDQDIIEQKYLSAHHYIKEQENKYQISMFSLLSKEDLVIKNFVENLGNLNVHTKGPELIFGTLFDRLGFNQISEELFRHITIARLAYPTSKLKTVDYLYRYKGINMEISHVYRFLDKFHKKYKSEVERIAYEHTKKKLKEITVVFYDMTTLYFEAEDEDDLRKIGFSKDGKFQKPQIMLGLLVGEQGLPIGYDIFKGNTFEGHTLMPIIKQIQKKYGFAKPIVVADAGLLSKDNLENLSEQKYEFIIGARIKNESKSIKEEILKKSLDLKNDESFIIQRKDGTRLVITYSDKRAKKDAYNRERGLRKLRQRVSSGKLRKEHINNRGYNKFLALFGEIKVKLDEKKIEEDKKWDGLKGYITNTKLKPKQITDNYKHLWQIEKAFRISKTDLRIRPIYHRKRDRIEAHICIAFVAYAIYKELEQLLYKNKVPFSVKRAAELTHNMYEIEFTLPSSRQREKIILKMDKEQKILYEMIRKNH
jgi:transposase